MKKQIRMMRASKYIEEYGDDCIEIGVQYLYYGVYDDGEDYEETSQIGWVFEDGHCEIVGCAHDFKCEFDVMIHTIENELDSIEKVYN